MEKAVYHFVGIKGTGMSALALILKDLGYQVQGSDITKKNIYRGGLTPGANSYIGICRRKHSAHNDHYCRKCL